MNVKKTIATIGLTGMIALTMGMTPAMADNGKSGDKDKGNSASQAAKNKEKGESNKAAAHAKAPGQVKKAETPAPVVPAPVVPVEPTPEAPVEEVPVEVVPDGNVVQTPEGEVVVGGGEAGPL